MTLDKLLMMSNRLEQARRCARPSWLKATAIVVSLIIATVFAEMRLSKITLIIPLSIYGFMSLRLCYWMFVTTRLTWIIEDELSEQIDRLPWSLQERVLNLFGPDWRLAAIECHESHIPGDCPLCGAN